MTESEAQEILNCGPVITVNEDGTKVADWSNVPTRRQQLEALGVRVAEGQIEQVARAICDSVEADDYDELPETSIARAIYLQQAFDAIIAYERSKK